jgi:hypothetical protein
MTEYAWSRKAGANLRYEQAGFDFYLASLVVQDSSTPFFVTHKRGFSVLLCQSRCGAQPHRREWSSGHSAVGEPRVTSSQITLDQRCKAEMPAVHKLSGGASGLSATFPLVLPDDETITPLNEPSLVPHFISGSLLSVKHVPLSVL